MALRWFAGGNPIDIMIIHGVGYNEVYKSVWDIVDAINQCQALETQLPSKDKQMKIATTFQQNLPTFCFACAGCINGILIWINKQNLVTTKRCGFGATKFFNGRKHKLA